ncbi:MAG: L,D-transpeptidase family protein [Hyphomicrobiaceae bacterium]|nr:L,D-transpeptidase family protein [Hyphomicrobiaceae bacterium]
MNIWQSSTLAVVMVALSAPAGSAQTAAADVREANANPVVQAQQIPTSPPDVVEQVQNARHPLIAAILAEIDKRSLAETDSGTKNWLSELAGFYGADGATPMWVSASGYLPRGWEAFTAMQNAGDYGLDAADFPVPEILTNSPSEAEVVAAEVQVSLAVTRYAFYARGGRIDPTKLSLWLDQKKQADIYASEIMRQIADRGDVTAALRAFHPQNPQFERLRRAYLAERGGASAPAAVIPSGPVLSRGDRGSDVPLIRKRLDVAADDGNETLVDRRLLKAVSAFMSEQGYGRKRAIDDEVRTALSKPSQTGGAKKKALLEKYVANMERWRWAPADFGQLHIWNNLPEFETRVVRNGEVIHKERIVIGTPSTQTPVFSDQMSHVIFQPEWGVPESIKIRDLLPKLRGGDTSVLSRRNMRIYADGKEISPSRFNWNKVDPRSVPIVQRSGPSNPLGQLKFIFPNAHDVYMHDTPSKGLFAESERTFSHGCIRVRNPQRFAEVVLGQVDGWTPEDVKRQLAIKDTRKVDLIKPIPVHNTYFTIVANADGTVSQLKDVYGHDRRVADALNGKSLQQIAASDPALALKRENERLKKIVIVKRPAAPRYDEWGYPIAYNSNTRRKPPPSLFWFGGGYDD